MVVALLDHLPEGHVRRVAVLRHVGRRHPERIGLNLERLLAAEEQLARERVNLGDLFVGHGVAAARGAVAVDHEKSTGAAVRAIIGIREAHIDREIVAGIRIHQAGGDGVEALRRLAVAFLDLGSEVARPAADRIGLQQRKAAGLVLFPDLELRLLLEDPHQDRRFLLHVPVVDLGDHPVRERLHVAAADRRRAVRLAAGKRNRRRNRSGRQERAHQRPTIQPGTPPNWLPHKKAFPKPSIPQSLPCSIVNPKELSPQGGRRLSMPMVNEGLILGQSEPPNPHTRLPAKVANQRLGQDLR